MRADIERPGHARHGLACSFAILNAMWHEMSLGDEGDRGSSEEAARW